MSVVLSKMKRDTFSCKVHVSLYGDKPGHVIPFEFSATFKQPTKQQVKEFGDNAEERTDEEFFNEWLVGLDGFVDDQGEAIDFETAKAAVLDNVPFGKALTNAFIEGMGGAQAKNSRASRGR